MSRQEQKERKIIVETMRRQGRKWTWLAEQTGYSKTHLNDMMRGRAALAPRFVKLAHVALGIREQDETLVA